MRILKHRVRYLASILVYHIITMLFRNENVSRGTSKKGNPLKRPLLTLFNGNDHTDFNPSYLITHFIYPDADKFQNDKRVFWFITKLFYGMT